MSIAVALISAREKNIRGANELFDMLSVSVFWNFSLMFETVISGQQDKIFVACISNIAASFAPVFFLFFVNAFTGHKKLKGFKRNILFLLPVLSIILAFTNKYHGLYWSDFSPVFSHNNLMIFYHGFLYWLFFVLYSYILFLFATARLIKFVLKYNRSFKFQSFIIIASAVLPWFASLVYILNYNPVPGLDITPLLYASLGIILGFTIYGLGFFDVLAVAREVIVESIDDGIIVFDNRFVVKDINSAALNILGLNSFNPSGLMIKEMPLANSILCNLVMSDTDVDSYEISEGKYISIKKLKISNDKNSSRVVILRDITKLKTESVKLEEEKENAEKSDKFKSTFLANVSHDIRTPINSILGFASVLEDIGDIDPEKKKEIFEMIKENGNKLLATLDDIIEISMLQSGKAVQNDALIDLSDFVNSIKVSVFSIAKEKGIKFHVHRMGFNENLVINIDKDKLYSIVYKLTVNSIMLLSSGHSLDLFFRITDDKLKIEVKDDGAGIPKEKQVNIFENYFRSDRLKGNEIDNKWNLYLYIVKANVDFLGGKIDFLSKVNSGTVFNVFLPVEIFNV